MHQSMPAGHVQHLHRIMVAKLAKPGADIVARMTYDNAHLLHMAVGLSGEAAEIAEAFHTAGAILEKLDRENVIEELGDMEFYLEGILTPWSLHERMPEIGATEPVSIWMVTRTVTELGIQVGHFLDKVKKIVIYNQDVDLADLVVILGRVSYAMAVIQAYLGVKREEVLEHNYHKLAKRYPNHDYSDAAAQNRADKTEG